MQKVWFHLEAKLTYGTGSEVCGSLGRWYDGRRSKGSFWGPSTSGLKAGYTGAFTLQFTEQSTRDSFTVYYTKFQLQTILSQMWQHTPVIPVIWEADTEGLQVQGQPGQVGESPSQNLKGGQRCCSAVEHLPTCVRQGSIWGQSFLLEKSKQQRTGRKIDII